MTEKSRQNSLRRASEKGRTISGRRSPGYKRAKQETGWFAYSCRHPFSGLKLIII
jgi:hypothetical protein